MIWVLTQEKKQLFYCTGFSINKNIGGKNKAALTGFTLAHDSFQAQVNLGMYADEDKARDELDRIMEFIALGEGKIYKMT